MPYLNFEHYLPDAVTSELSRSSGPPGALRNGAVEQPQIAGSLALARRIGRAHRARVGDLFGIPLSHLVKGQRTMANPNWSRPSGLRE